MDLENSCRLCLIPNKISIDMFSLVGTTLNIPSILAKHFAIEVMEDDNLPRHICSECWQLTCNFNSLYCRVENTQKIYGDRSIKEGIGVESVPVPGLNNRLVSSSDPSLGDVKNETEIFVEALRVNGSEHGISEDFEINDDEPQVKRIKTEIQIDETMTVDPDDVERLLMNSLNGDMNESNNLPIDDYCVDQSESLSPLSTEDMTRLQELMYRFHYAQMAQLQKIENDMKPKSRNGVVYKDVIRITNFSKVHKFPMKTAQDIERLENDLLNVDTLNEFKNYLLHLGGKNVRSIIKIITEKLYDLPLQQQMNYTGRDGKFRMQGLKQTEIVLDVMQINGKQPESTVIKEYMYHMQHFPDRVRAYNLLLAREAKKGES